MNTLEVQALKNLKDAFERQVKINQDIVDIVTRLDKRVSVLENTLKMMRDQR